MYANNLINFLEVGMDGVRADVQSGGHFLFRESFHQQTKDSELGPRQAERLGGGQAPSSRDRYYRCSDRTGLPRRPGLFCHGCLAIHEAAVLLTLQRFIFFPEKGT